MSKYIELTNEEYTGILEARESINEFKSDIKTSVDAKLFRDKMSGDHFAGKTKEVNKQIHDAWSRQGSGIHAKSMQDKKDIDTINKANSRVLDKIGNNTKKSDRIKEILNDKNYSKKEKDALERMSSKSAGYNT